MTILAALQRQLAEQNDVRTELDIEEFVVDRDVHRLMPGAQPESAEQLFVSESDGELELAVYVAPDVLSRLEADDPRRCLHGGNLESFCIALEGVSHFLMLAHRAVHGHAVTALELELQAEVDKFVAAWMLLAAQGIGLETSGPALLRALFQGYRLHDEVPASQADRYHVASRAAGEFCRQLVARHGRQGDVATVERQARSYYRRGLDHKLRGG